MARPTFRESTNEAPWPIKHAPSHLSEIALHPQKLEQIRISLSADSPTRLLVLSGPPGSAKSTCIRLIAQDQGKQIIEYAAPESFAGSTSLMRSFQEFLAGAAMYSRRNTVVLVEDLPNIFHGDTQRIFENNLMNWVQESKMERSELPIIVVCFTEVEVNARYDEALLVSRVLGTLVEMKPAVDWIKVNPVNAQLIKRRIAAVCAAENLKIGSQQQKRISQCGDIRSALNSLELLSRTKSLPRKSTDLWIRDDKVELFHAIGKLVYGSKDPHTVSAHITEFETTIGAFNLTLLENYTSAKHQQLPISAAAQCAEWLSFGNFAESAGGISSTASEIVLLTALGVGSLIAHCSPDSNLPRKFAPLKFTQHFKWLKEHYDTRAKLNSQMDIRSGELHKLAMDVNAFKIVKNRDTYLLDSSSEDEFDML